MSTIGDFRSTGSVLGNFYSTWTLPDFSGYDSTFGKCHRSGFSHSLRQTEVKYYLTLYPGGDREEGYVACYLHFSFPDAYEKELTASHFLTFLNENGDVLVTFGVENLFKPDCGWGCHKMIKKDLLLSKLTKNTLRIVCEGVYSMTTVTKNNTTQYFSEVSPYAKLGKEKASEKQSTVTNGRKRALICVGNVSVPVDKSVLTANSDVFAAMFNHDTKENQTKRVKLEDLDATTVRLMVGFLKTRRIKLLTYDSALKLLRAADKYNMDSLKNVCAFFLLSQIDKSNFVEILLSAEQFNAHTLRQEAIQYIHQYRSDINVDEHEELKKHPQLVWEIFKVMMKK